MIRVLKNSLLVFGLLLCCKPHAQFKNKASLATVSKTGFYAIAVTPELSGYVKTDFSDLRIMDDSGKPVPYIIEGSITKQYDTAYLQLRIIDNKLDDSGRSIVTIQNIAKASLKSIALLIRNNAVRRYTAITGSDDNQHWYSIVENRLLENGGDAGKDRYIQAVDFPVSSYRYFRLVINNGNNAPLNIMSAGEYKFTSIKSKPAIISNPQGKFRQVDSSDGNSYIHVFDEQPYHKQFIKIALGGQKFYYRSGKIVVDNRIIASFTASPDTATAIVIPAFKSRNWFIYIPNGDNPPLKATSVITAQEAKRVIAWLDTGRTYHLEINDSFAVAPVYDLQNFKDSIPAYVEEIKFGDIQVIEKPAAVVSNSFFSKAWLWPVMILVLLVLIAFTWRLTKEMGKSDK